MAHPEPRLSKLPDFPGMAAEKTLSIIGSSRRFSRQRNAVCECEQKCGHEHNREQENRNGCKDDGIGKHDLIPNCRPMIGPPIRRAGRTGCYTAGTIFWTGPGVSWDQFRDQARKAAGSASRRARGATTRQARAISRALYGG
jgi:hypothetical protein